MIVPSENETVVPTPDMPTNFQPLKPQVTQQDARASAPAAFSESILETPAGESISSGAQQNRQQSQPQQYQQPLYQQPMYQPVEDEYLIISNNAPELLNDYAVQPPEDSGPPSEALSVILGRAAVQEHMLNIGDTMGVRPTPVPVQFPAPGKKGKKTSGHDPSILGLNTDEPQHPVLDHGTQQKNPNQIVYILVGIIVALVLVVLALVFSMRGRPEAGDRRTETLKIVGEIAVKKIL